MPDTRSAVTIYDIARGADVSIATVSRAFNGHPRVSESTREKVFRVARDLGYEPHASAQSLARKNTGLISAVVPVMTSPFFMEVLRGIQDRLEATDLDLVVYTSRRVDAVEGPLSRAVQRGRADGLVLVSTPLSDERVRQITASRQPAVLVDGYHPELPSVSIDNRLGGALAVRHLLERGHSRIGLVMPEPGSAPAERRREGYEDALAEAGLGLDPDLVVYSEWDLPQHGYSRYAGYRACRALLDRFAGRADGPTALFVAADVLAYGALRAAREAGLRPGRDVDVVGFDDLEPSAYVGLSTVRQPMAAMGRLAMDLLARRLDGGPSRPRHAVFAPELVVRETTGGPSSEVA